MNNDSPSAESGINPSTVARLDTRESIAGPSYIPVVLLLAVLGVEIVLQVLQARAKIFWYDELLTFHISSLPSWALVWKALKAGADGLPPGYYLLTRAGLSLPGAPEIALRLPSLAGYLSALLGVYWFASRRLPAIAGVAAAILVVLSPFRPYAVEARSYALLVGFLALAAVAWQRIGERRLMTPLFFLFLTLAICCHFMSVVAISIFVVAEAARTAMVRRVRWGVWIACLLSTVPTLVSLPGLLAYKQQYGKGFWAQPTWGNIVTTYGEYLGLDYKLAVPVIVLLILLIADSLREMVRNPKPKSPPSGFQAPELVLLAGFLAYPAVLSLLTRVLGSGYTPRYGWPAILGLALATVHFARGIWNRPAGSFLVAGLLTGFLIQAGYDVRTLRSSKLPKADERWNVLSELSRRTPDLPVIVGSPLSYLQALQYGAPDLRGRLVEVLDEDAALRLVGSDTVDRTNRTLAEFMPLHNESLAGIQSGYRRFLLQSGGYLDWFTTYAIRNGYHLTLLANYTDQSLYLVER